MSTTRPADLAECLAPLDDASRRAVRRYWEQVIREEWVPPVRRVPGPASLTTGNEGRARRQARQAVARIAEASQMARVHTLPNAAQARPGCRDEA